MDRLGARVVVDALRGLPALAWAAGPEDTDGAGDRELPLTAVR